MEIIKILPYDVYGGDVSKYKYVCDLLMQTIDPVSLEPGKLNCRNLYVYTSPRRRAITCINVDTAKSIIINESLNEIPFSLRRYCSEENFIQYGSVAVRKAFNDSFVNDDLGISHQKLQYEIKEILHLHEVSRPVLCVSHTFRMKCIEVYNQIGDRMFKEPGQIRKFINPKKHLFHFGEEIAV